MQLLIIEDEKPAARLLQRKLQKLGYQQINSVHSIAEADSWLSENHAPELIFMDIQLSDGTAFDLLGKRTIPSAIIFTTAFDEYTLRAFKENSVDYLLKPINEDELAQAINKYVLRKNPAYNINAIKALLTSSEPNYKDRFTVKIGQSIRIITQRDIVCFYSANGGTYARTDNGHDYLIDFTLDELSKLLDPKAFFRINRSHIIHLPAIKDISLHSNWRLKINLQNYNSEDSIVSRERVGSFKEWLG